jgi:hypothetical protein
MNISPIVKPAIWGAVGGAVALAILGFTWGGWVTGGTAKVMANKQADVAVVKVLAPICVDNFLRAPDVVANTTALKATSSYQQASFLEKGGWATMVGSDRPFSGTAKACAELLSKLPQ